MTRSRLLLGIAGVLGGTAALFLVLGAVFNLILLLVALPFAAAAYFLWMQATGQLHRRVGRRFLDGEVGQRSAAARGRERAERTRWERADGQSRKEPTVPMDRTEALSTLDLAPDAGQRAIKRAYRDRVKAVHPDAADGGDEDEFRRVRAAYERLSGPVRGKD